MSWTTPNGLLQQHLTQTSKQHLAATLMDYDGLLFRLEMAPNKALIWSNFQEAVFGSGASHRFNCLVTGQYPPQPLCIAGSDFRGRNGKALSCLGKHRPNLNHPVIFPTPQKIPWWAAPCAAPSASSSEVGCSTWPSSHRGVSSAKAMTWSCWDGNLPWLQQTRGLKQAELALDQGKQGCKGWRHRISMEKSDGLLPKNAELPANVHLAYTSMNGVAEPCYFFPLTHGSLPGAAIPPNPRRDATAPRSPPWHLPGLSLGAAPGASGAANVWRASSAWDSPAWHSHHPRA